jgi:hypothetical protein
MSSAEAVLRETTNKRRWRRQVDEVSSSHRLAWCTLLSHFAAWENSCVSPEWRLLAVPAITALEVDEISGVKGPGGPLKRRCHRGTRSSKKSGPQSACPSRKNRRCARLRISPAEISNVERQYLTYIRVTTSNPKRPTPKVKSPGVTRRVQKHRDRLAKKGELLFQMSEEKRKSSSWDDDSWVRGMCGTYHFARIHRRALRKRADRLAFKVVSLLNANYQTHVVRALCHHKGTQASLDSK